MIVIELRMREFNINELYSLHYIVHSNPDEESGKVEAT
jgi:hypothetical protein